MIVGIGLRTRIRTRFNVVSIARWALHAFRFLTFLGTTLISTRLGVGTGPVLGLVGDQQLTFQGGGAGRRLAAAIFVERIARFIRPSRRARWRSSGDTYVLANPKRAFFADTVGAIAIVLAFVGFFALPRVATTGATLLGLRTPLTQLLKRQTLVTANIKRAFCTVSTFVTISIFFAGWSSFQTFEAPVIRFTVFSHVLPSLIGRALFLASVQELIVNSTRAVVHDVGAPIAP